jgi:hypothetical protein
MIRRQLEPQEIATQARVELADEQKAEITGTMVCPTAATKSWAS